MTVREWSTHEQEKKQDLAPADWRICPECDAHWPHPPRDEEKRCPGCLAYQARVLARGEFAHVLRTRWRMWERKYAQAEAQPGRTRAVVAREEDKALFKILQALRSTNGNQ